MNAVLGQEAFKGIKKVRTGSSGDRVLTSQLARVDVRVEQAHHVLGEGQKRRG
jgi:hypothetical protein